MTDKDEFNKLARELVYERRRAIEYSPDNIWTLEGKLLVQAVESALRNVHNKAVEECARQAETEYVNRQSSDIDDDYVNGLFSAQEAIAQAQADAAAAGVESGRLREQARRLAARASQCASNPGAAQGGPAAGHPAMVLADLLSRADERAGELAAAYDRARASGLACERAYLSLTQPR